MADMSLRLVLLIWLRRCNLAYRLRLFDDQELHELVEAWALALGERDPEKIQAAFVAHLAESREFPRPCEILERLPAAALPKPAASCQVIPFKPANPGRVAREWLSQQRRKESDCSWLNPLLKKTGEKQ